MDDEYELLLKKQIEDIEAEMASLQKRNATLRQRVVGLRSALELYKQSIRDTKKQKNPTSHVKTQREIVLELLEQTWPNGLRLGELLKKAKERGFDLNENTVASHLSRAFKGGLVRKQHLQRYVRPPGGFPAEDNDR
ncbi:MAG: hypothetical protein ACM31D_14980 [Bacteroidota bacterium]